MQDTPNVKRETKGRKRKGRSNAMKCSNTITNIHPTECSVVTRIAKTNLDRLGEGATLADGSVHLIETKPKGRKRKFKKKVTRGSTSYNNVVLGSDYIPCGSDLVKEEAKPEVVNGYPSVDEVNESLRKVMASEASGRNVKQPPSLLDRFLGWIYGV